MPSRFQSSQKPDLENATQGGPAHEQIGPLPARQACRSEDVSCGESLAGAGGEGVQVGANHLAQTRKVVRSVLLHGVAGVVVPFHRGQDGEPRRPRPPSRGPRRRRTARSPNRLSHPQSARCSRPGRAPSAHPQDAIARLAPRRSIRGGSTPRSTQQGYDVRGRWCRSARATEVANRPGRRRDDR